MHVLIAGGGVAGSVTAMALQQAGIEATIFEAHPQTDADIGSYLSVAPNGLDALTRSVRSHASPARASRLDATCCGTRMAAGSARRDSARRCPTALPRRR